MPQIKLIAFDADDTLWHNETFYRASKTRFIEILAPYASEEAVSHHLDEVELRNIHTFGYGIKAFVLSMIETAVDVSKERVLGGEVRQIIELGKAMLSFDMQVLEGVEQTLARLSDRYALMIITKGDLMDQEAKLARSGIAGYFRAIEIVSEKNAETYHKILDRHQIPPNQFMMVGNSLKSDILPVLEIGGLAVYVPYEHTWVHETRIDGDIDRTKYYEIEKIELLPELIENHLDEKAGPA